MPGSLRPDVDRAGAPTFGKERHRMGGSSRRRSRSAWSGRIVIAKPVDPTREQVNEVSLGGTGSALSRTFWPVCLIPSNARQEGQPAICLSQSLQHRRDKPKVEAEESQRP
jgi:hypothetical protein